MLAPFSPAGSAQTTVKGFLGLDLDLSRIATKAISDCDGKFGMTSLAIEVNSDLLGENLGIEASGAMTKHLVESFAPLIASQVTRRPQRRRAPPLPSPRPRPPQRRRAPARPPTPRPHRGPPPPHCPPPPQMHAIICHGNGLADVNIVLHDPPEGEEGDVDLEAEPVAEVERFRGTRSPCAAAGRRAARVSSRLRL